MNISLQPDDQGSFHQFYPDLPVQNGAPARGNNKVFPGQKREKKITLCRAEIIPSMFRHHFADALPLLFFYFPICVEKRKE
jgi:hypothetical protein